MKVSEKVYLKYEYLAKKYASKIFSYEELSFEYEDLVQEFRLKIFSSICAYGRRYAKFLRGVAPRPVPIRYYLEAACANKARDFIKYIVREGHKIRIDDLGCDFGTEQNLILDADANKFIIRDVDLLEGLTGKERAVFSLFLRGYGINFLRKVYFSNAREKAQRQKVREEGDEPIDVIDIIETQRNYLVSKYGDALKQTTRRYVTYNMDED